MTPSAVAVGRRTLVWMVAAAAAINSFTNCWIATEKGLGLEAWAWGVATIATILLATGIETTKQFLGDS